jgi:hypothetical protein
MRGVCPIDFIVGKLSDGMRAFYVGLSGLVVFIAP